MLYGDKTRVTPLLTHALLGLPVPDDQVGSFPKELIFEGSDHTKKLLIPAAELSPPDVQVFSSGFISFLSEYAANIRRQAQC